MASRVLLLRAVNVGTRRIAMPALRELLAEAGMGDVRTYVGSGNVVVSSRVASDKLAREARQLISERFGFDVPVIVRTAQELEAVLDTDPFGDIVTEPKRYWVTFMDAELPADRMERLAGLAVEGEHVQVVGRELYAWLPGGGGRSKLGAALGAPAKGVTATARNWLTVQTLHGMATGRL
jgi:uncharacterized protein (DUF1697 family)